MLPPAHPTSGLWTEPAYSPDTDEEDGQSSNDVQ